MNKFLKIFPGTFIFLFVSGLIAVWFLMMDPWNRTFENFKNMFAYMCVLYFPLWLGILAQERSDEYPRLSRFLNNKLVVTILLIIWFLAAIGGINYFKIV